MSVVGVGGFVGVLVSLIVGDVGFVVCVRCYCCLRLLLMLAVVVR